MADAQQLWIYYTNHVIYAIFGVITKENFNQSYSAPRCAGKLYGISIDWSQTVSPPLQGGEISLLSQTNQFRNRTK
jgi:hypothetical protein